MLKINILSKISPDKLKIAAIIFIIALLICITVITTHKKSSHEVIGETYLNNLDQVKVEIKGEVNKPGVYSVNNGIRVGEVIQMAGDFTYKADASKVSMTTKVTDGMIIYVPTGKEYYTVQDYAENSDMVVEVKGEVLNPGIYDVSQDLTIYNVITMAGGFLKDADIEGLNLMEKVTDGMTITVKKKASGKISINTATKEDLITLTGIGEAKAESIIDYRIANGPFTKLDDLMKVSGISEKVYSKIKDQLCL